MKTKHTQGEWKVEGDDIVSWKECQRVAEADGETPQETEANAKLIASAPELLEALITAKRTIETSELAGVKASKEIKSKINEAIKKATA